MNEKNFLKDQHGSVLLIIAIFLPVALGLLALVLNVGIIYYAKSAYTSIANTATASAISHIGDEIVSIIENKIDNDPLFEPEDDAWDNLNDDDRKKLTEDSAIINKIENIVEEYLQKNTAPGTIMRNDFILKNTVIDYPYNYDSSDNFVKVHLEFNVEAPISFIDTINKKDILIKAESQLRIK